MPLALPLPLAHQHQKAIFSDTAKRLRGHGWRAGGGGGGVHGVRRQRLFRFGRSGLSPLQDVEGEGRRHLAAYFSHYSYVDKPVNWDDSKLQPKNAIDGATSAAVKAVFNTRLQ